MWFQCFVFLITSSATLIFSCFDWIAIGFRLFCLNLIWLNQDMYLVVETPVAQKMDAVCFRPVFLIFWGGEVQTSRLFIV